MKTRKDLATILKKNKPVLEKVYKVREIGIFGSFARGEEHDDSDLDLLVEFSEPVGWEFIDLKEYLEEIFDREVDLVTKNALKPQMRNRILREVVYA